MKLDPSLLKVENSGLVVDFIASDLASSTLLLDSSALFLDLSAPFLTMSPLLLDQRGVFLDHRKVEPRKRQIFSFPRQRQADSERVLAGGRVR